MGNPCVLIGPNNSGKTTVLQALALWSRAVKAWFYGRREAIDGAVVLNRLQILEVPVKATKYFWHDGIVEREKSSFSISAVLVTKTGLQPLTMRFSYHDAESVAVRLAEAVDEKLLALASQLDCRLLFPMSGIAAGVSGDTDEPLIAEGRVNVLLGQGQTAKILRNLCYSLWEKSPADWQRICELMKRIFHIKLGLPQFDPARGSLFLDYQMLSGNTSLEIGLAGRGQQQMLLLLTYLFSYKKAIVLIDEPDAHLEIHRQRQAFSLLNSVAYETQSQVVLATHSEIILNEAYAGNIVSIADGMVVEFSRNGDVLTTLRNIGIQHYYHASHKNGY